jgi:serine/threonine protein kinase
LANFAYAAPEQRISGKAVGQRADIYALGLILNEMYTGQIPQGTGFRQIKDIAPEFGYLDELVAIMVRQQPEQRPESVTKVKEDLIGRGNQFIQFQRLETLKKENSARIRSQRSTDCRPYSRDREGRLEQRDLDA